MKGIKPLYIKNKKRLVFNRRFFYLVGFVMFLQGVSQAQGPDGFKNSLKDKRSIYFTWDSKATFITNQYAQMKSVKLGFDFGGKTKLGVGYNWYKGKIVRSFGTNENLQRANLKFRYVSIFTEYVYFLNDKWEATIPAQLGVGVLQYNKEFTKEKIARAGGTFMLYEPASTITYRFLRYFGVGIGIGYRLVLLTGSNPHNEKFASPIFMFRTKIYFEYALKDLKKIIH